MAVVTEVTVPASAFELGRLFGVRSGVEFELARSAPIDGQGDPPRLWVTDDHAAALEAALRDHHHTDEVRRVTDADDRTLLEVAWVETPGELVEPIRACDGRILAAEGSAEEWRLRLAFDDRAAVSRFTDLASARDVPVTLEGETEPSPPGEPSLSAKQVEAVSLAHERGYFEVPRSVSVGELAAEVDISDNAFSQRLRRGLSVLVEGSERIDPPAAPGE